MSKTKNKPHDPKLPGALGKMTEAELAAEVARYDVAGTAEAEADAFAKSGAARPAHPKKRRKPGPAPKPAGEKSERVLITIEPELLRKADAFVKKARIDGGRSGWIQQLMREAIAAGELSTVSVDGVLSVIRGKRSVPVSELMNAVRAACAPTVSPYQRHSDTRGARIDLRHSTTLSTEGTSRSRAPRDIRI